MCSFDLIRTFEPALPSIFLLPYLTITEISLRHISKGHVVPIFHLRFPRHQRCQHRAQRGHGQRSGRDRGVKRPGRSLVRRHTGGDMLHPWWICGFLGDSDGILTIKISINPINMEFGRGLNRGNKWKQSFAAILVENIMINHQIWGHHQAHIKDIRYHPLHDAVFALQYYTWCWRGVWYLQGRIVWTKSNTW